MIQKNPFGISTGVVGFSVDPNVSGIELKTIDSSGVNGIYAVEMNFLVTSFSSSETMIGTFTNINPFVRTNGVILRNTNSEIIGGCVALNGQVFIKLNTTYTGNIRMSFILVSKV